jgi:hypothetical protein
MPSYPNLTPDLGKINFSDIKTSITNYLKNQDSLKDFNFEGSVMQTLINTLAYNTYYYAFYGNMIANESFLDSAQRIDSLISLTKPLGYFIPLKTSAKAVVNVSGLILDIPQFASFRGLNSDGIVYNFYTIKSYDGTSGQALDVEIYEGNLVKNLEVTNLFDNIKQRFFINDTNLDASTIKVRVARNGQNVTTSATEWSLVDTFGSIPVINQDVFYLERANNGVYVTFGKINSLGNSVDGNADKIFIDYLSSSGAAANDISAFSLTEPDIAGNVGIGLVQKSQGGLDEPDIDLVKFAAPKAFGAQNRAVTKDDIKALIAPFFQSPNDFNVFGGDEIFPQRFGRVFFTANLNPNNDEDALKIQNIYNILLDKCVVTVLPEFTLPKNLTILNDVTMRFTTTRSTSSPASDQNIKNGVKNILLNNYNSSGSYNFEFKATDAITDIQEQYPDVIIESNDFRIYYRETFTNNGLITINLENELDIPYFIDYDITGEFKNKSNVTVKLVAYYTPAQNKFAFFNLKTLKKNSDGTFSPSTEVLGRINVKKGIIEIYDKRLSGTSVSVEIDFKNSYFKSTTNSLVSFITNSVEIN